MRSEKSPPSLCTGLLLLTKLENVLAGNRQSYQRFSVLKGYTQSQSNLASNVIYRIIICLDGQGQVHSFKIQAYSIYIMKD